ncbi:hypothetical protein EMGBS6_15420 [Opitutia bacterium]|nr:hypothetical protein EMGBS6_15420 [Opitutae bacterium]
MDPTGQRWQVGERPRVQADISQYNEFTVIARGNRLEHKVNGQTTSVFIDHDEKGRALDGLIAIQLHAGNPHKTYVKQVLLRSSKMGLSCPSTKPPSPPVLRRSTSQGRQRQGKNPPAKKAPAKK